MKRSQYRILAEQYSKICENEDEDLLAAVDRLGGDIVVSVNGKPIRVKDTNYVLRNFNFSNDMIRWIVEREIKDWDRAYFSRSGSFDFDALYEDLLSDKIDDYEADDLDDLLDNFPEVHDEIKQELERGYQNDQARKPGNSEINENEDEDLLAAVDKLTGDIVVNFRGKKIKIKDDNYNLKGFNFNEDMIKFILTYEAENWGSRYFSSEGYFDFDEYYNDLFEHKLEYYLYDDENEDGDLPPDIETTINRQIKEDLEYSYQVYLARGRRTKGDDRVVRIQPLP